MAQQKIALECPIDKARQDLPVDPLDPATRIKMTGAGDSIFIPLGGCCCCCKRGRDWPEVDRISSRPLHLGTIIKTRSSNTIVIILMMGTFTVFGTVIIMLKVKLIIQVLEPATTVPDPLYMLKRATIEIIKTGNK